MAGTDAAFAGSIPALYDRHLGPLLFEPYAERLALGVAHLSSGALLETAAGTGIVTQALGRHLPAGVRLVATDLNQAMLDFAATKPGLARAELRQADATALPFDAGSFDTVVCQFGMMFFPDRVAGYREARRVLKPGGRACFSLWDSLAHNAIPRCVNEALARHLPADPPRFLARTPHGPMTRRRSDANWRKPGSGESPLKPSRCQAGPPRIGIRPSASVRAVRCGRRSRRARHRA